MKRRILPLLIALWSWLACHPVFANDTWESLYAQQQQTSAAGDSQFNAAPNHQFYPNQNSAQNVNAGFGAINPGFGSANPGFNQGYASNNAVFAQNQYQQMPVLNSTMQAAPNAMNGYAQQSYFNHDPAIGTSRGVDILDESLHFHTRMGNINQMQQLPANYNSMGSMNSMNSMGSVGQTNSACSHCHHGHSCGGTVNGANQMVNNQPQTAQSQLNKPIDSKMIGALGAAALMGSFMSNGGVGGMFKSIPGWDNSRHIRGMSIGGY